MQGETLGGARGCKCTIAQHRGLPVRDPCQHNMRRSTLKVGDYVKVLDAFVDTHLIGRTVRVKRIVDSSVWVEGSTTSWNLKNISNFLKKVSTTNKKDMARKTPTKFLVTWEFDNDDPMEEFTTKEAAIKFARDLQNDDTDHHVPDDGTVRIWEVSKQYKVSYDPSLVEVK